MNPEHGERACFVAQSPHRECAFLNSLRFDHTSSVNLLVLGAGLIVFAVTLVINARKQQVKKSDAWIAVCMDVAWVIGSYVLILVVPFSTEGKWVVGAVAEAVLVFAVLQFVGIRRIVPLKFSPPIDSLIFGVF
jgi:hypothetical protein